MEDKRPEAFAFATRHDAPLNMNNFPRAIKPAAGSAQAEELKRNPDLPSSFLAKLNHQVFRRTCATHMQKLGTVKDIQAHVRHTTPAMTINEYMQEIPESVRAAAESPDDKLKAAQSAETENILNTELRRIEE